MTITHAIETFFIAAVIFAVIDLFWITLVVNKMYREELGSIVAKKPRPLPAALFYIIYIAGLVYFAIAPAVDANSASHALRDGALYGFFTYATFDLTNWAVLKDWTLKVVIADMIWGVIISSVVALITTEIMLRIV